MFPAHFTFFAKENGFFGIFNIMKGRIRMPYNKNRGKNAAGTDTIDKIINSVTSHRAKSPISIDALTPDIKLPPRTEESTFSSDFDSEPVINAGKKPQKRKKQKQKTQSAEKPRSEQEAEQKPATAEFSGKKKKKRNQNQNQNQNQNHPKNEATAAVLPSKAPSRRRAAKSSPDLITAAMAPAVSTPVNLGARNTERRNAPKGKLKKLRIIPLGGLGEIGKNITALEYSDNILIVDCGIGFPDDDMLGVDLVVPDFTYLVNNKEKIRGVVITHGHEDHVGAVPYLLQKINVPVYATRLTLGILERKLQEHSLDFVPQLNCVNAGEKINLGVFEVEFIRVNHSIADAVCLAIRTPVGIVVHSGDFKIDTTPVDGEMTDLTRLGEIGREGVTLLMCESTNVERPGFTPSEKKVGHSLVRFFEEYKDKRIVISTFSSNVHRVQQIIDIAARYGRKVAITGRSMLYVIGAAIKLGYMNVPAGVLVDISTIKNYPPKKMTVVSTGSQGEPMSALYRMAYNMHDKVDLGPHDVVIISASAIPGNEKLVGNIINELYRKGVRVLSDSVAEVHVSGHACQEEIKIMHALTKPKYFMPIHGEARHLYMHKELAEYMGMTADHIFVSEIGKVLEIGTDGAKFNGTVPAGIVMIDGSGVGDVGNIVLRDRRLLSQDGIIVVCIPIDMENDDLAARPEVVSRGFVYVKESEELLDRLKEIAEDAVRESLAAHHRDYSSIKSKVKDELGRYIYSQTKRKPMVLPIIV